jgi:hypothetical protein
MKTVTVCIDIATQLLSWQTKQDQVCQKADAYYITKSHNHTLHLPFITMKFSTLLFYIGFAVLTAMVMKSTTFWDITPCSPLNVD